MKTIFAATLAILIALPNAGNSAVMKCQMNIMRIENGEMSGTPHRVAEAILTADAHQFYAVVGERIISSPILSENKGDLAAYHSGAAYFMRKNSFGVIYDDFGYVFDECEKTILACQGFYPPGRLLNQVRAKRLSDCVSLPLVADD